jgi:hypothetical protein
MLNMTFFLVALAPASFLEHVHWGNPDEFGDDAVGDVRADPEAVHAQEGARRGQGSGWQQRARATRRPSQARLPQDGREGGAAAAPAGDAATAAGDQEARQDRRVRRASEDAGVRERVGCRQGPGELVRLCRGVQPGQVPGNARRGLQRRAPRVHPVRCRAANLPRPGHGRHQRGVHAGQPALLFRLDAAGGREHGGDRRAHVPPQDAAGARAHCARSNSIVSGAWLADRISARRLATIYGSNNASSVLSPPTCKLVFLSRSFVASFFEGRQHWV